MYCQINVRVASEKLPLWEKRHSKQYVFQDFQDFWHFKYCAVTNNIFFLFSKNCISITSLKRALAIAGSRVIGPAVTQKNAALGRAVTRQREYCWSGPSPERAHAREGTRQSGHLQERALASWLSLSLIKDFNNIGKITDQICFETGNTGGFFQQRMNQSAFFIR